MGQVDKTGHPYISHLDRVAGILSDCGFPPALVVAGLLHDALEDTALTSEKLEESAGPAVAALVKSVSRRPDETYRAFIARASQEAESSVVKIADVVDHLDPSLAAGLTPSLRTRYEQALGTLLAALEHNPDDLPGPALEALTTLTTERLERSRGHSES